MSNVNDNGPGDEFRMEADSDADVRTPDAPAVESDPEARIAELEADLHAMQEDLLRERAELENFKKRMLREKGEALRFAQEPLLRDLLPIVDNLERALAHADSASVAEGLQLVLKGLFDAMARHGVERVEALGSLFDPEMHEAIGQADRADAPPGAVVEQHQVGYRLHSRLLRPALVTVNTRKSAGPGANEDASV